MVAFERDRAVTAPPDGQHADVSAWLQVVKGARQQLYPRTDPGGRLDAVLFALDEMLDTELGKPYHPAGKTTMRETTMSVPGAGVFTEQPIWSYQ